MGLLNFNYGDIYNEDTESIFWEIVKSIIAVLPVLAGLLIQKRLERIKENKRLIMKLYNFNEHLTPIIKSSDRLSNVFEPFQKAILEKPFDEHLIEVRLFIPDLYRIREINQENLFDAFYLVCDDKIQASTMYRQAMNQLEFYKSLFELLYSKYDALSIDIVNQKMKFVDDLNIITIKAIKIMFMNEGLNASSKVIKDIMERNKEVKENTIVGLQNLDFFYDNIITPLAEKLVDFEKEPEISELYALIAQLQRQKKVIITDSVALGNLIKNNISLIPECITKVIEVRDFLDLKLKKK